MPDLRVDADVMAEVRSALRAAARPRGRGAPLPGCLGSAVVEATYTRAHDVLGWAVDALNTSALDAAAGVASAGHEITRVDRELDRAAR
jgi:hypothetical protein